MKQPDETADSEPKQYQCWLCESDWGTDRDAARKCCAKAKAEIQRKTVTSQQ